MIVGCYSLHLYCENYDTDSVLRGEHEGDEFPHEFTDEFGSKCRANARRLGWKVNYKTGEALCPKCAKRKKQP